MRRLIIGSVAARLYIPYYRVPKDFDLFSPDDLNHQTLNVETFWHPSFEEWIPEGTNRAATLDELYTIKVSHSAWDLGYGSWEKHIHDAMTFKAAGARLDGLKYRSLYKVWEEKHGKKRVNLNMDKEDFFDDAVKRKYDHDSIHYSVAYGDRPLYESVHVPGANIAMDMAAIKALPFEQQVRLYREEIYATALERWVIPSDYRVSPKLAYHRAVKKTITSLTKGWSSQFIIENYDTFRLPDINYVAHHLSRKDRLIEIE